MPVLTQEDAHALGWIVMAACRIVPTDFGGVQLEWHRDGFDIEIDVNVEGRITGALVSTDEHCAQRDKKGD